MKFLNLVLFSTDNSYGNMKDVTTRYYSTLENVKTIYYRFDPDIQSDYELRDNVLLIKGRETFVPGILDKTIKALEYVVNNRLIDDCDYILRTNVSTVVNFANLEREMLPIPFYGGVYAPILQWLDPKAGIIDNKWFGTQFVSGCGIVFSKEGVLCLLKNKNLLEKTIVDDVAIGIFFARYLKTAPVVFDRKLWHVWYEHENISKNDLNSKVFFRCRDKHGMNRELDVQHLKQIVDMLI